MNCHVAWNRDFIDSHLSKTFRLNEYKKHRENILVDREKSLLPATVPVVEAEKAAREREKTAKDLIKKRDLLMNQVNEINLQISNIRYNHRYFHGEAGPSNAERKQFIRACVMPECRGFLSSQWKCGICTTWVCPDCHEPKASQKDPDHKCDPNNVETAKLLAKDTKPCPKCASMIFKIDGCFAKDTPIIMWDGATKMAQDVKVGDILIGDDFTPRNVLETCNGEDNLYTISQDQGDSYTVNSKHKLVLRRKQNEEIVIITITDYLNLNESDRQQLTGVKNNLKEPIITNIKVTPVGRGKYFGWMLDGNNLFIGKDNTILSNCDFMWCIVCQTSFSWKTGQEIVTNNIHNPEYYRYIREKNGGVIPRNLGDLPMACGGMPAFWTVHPFIIKWQKVDGRLPKIQSLHRVLGHIQDIELRRNRPNIFTNNQDLRVRYLLSEISEADWKQELQKREKKSEINTARRNVYEMLVTIGTDLMNKLLRSKTAEEIKETIDEFDKVVEYYNDSIRNVAERFGSKSAKVFNEDWVWS
jgi:hypothetical protein